MSPLFAGNISDIFLPSFLQSFAFFYRFLFKLLTFHYGFYNQADSTRDPFVLYQESSITYAESSNPLSQERLPRPEPGIA